nr:MAG TPA: hypothetical protein [Caudoviricetes sp.]
MQASFLQTSLLLFYIFRFYHLFKECWFHFIFDLVILIRISTLTSVVRRQSY